MEEKNLYEQRNNQFEFLREQFNSYKIALDEQLIKDTRKIVGMLKPEAEVEIKMHPDIITIDINDPEYYNLYIDLQGICIVTLVDNDGAVIDGKPELGVHKYKNLSLIFDSSESIAKFYSDPDN